MATEIVDPIESKKEALRKLFIDLSSGHAGLSSTIRFLDQIHIPELKDQKVKLKRGYLQYDMLCKLTAQERKPESPDKPTMEQISEMFTGLGIAYQAACASLRLVCKVLFKGESILNSSQMAQVLRFVHNTYPGDMRYPTEERQLLQYLALANLRQLPEEADAIFIVHAILVLKYGYAYDSCNLPELDHYTQAVEAFTKVSDETLSFMGS